MELVRLLEALIKLGGSDLHLQAGAPPMVRIGGDLKGLETPPLEDSQIRQYMQQMSPSQAQIRLEEKRSADFGFEMAGAARFRVNAFYERQRLALARAWKGARSCNLAVWRSDLDRVDGFDARFSGWGKEDSDLLVRLLHAGVRRKDGAYATGVLHLWHAEADRSQLAQNEQRLAGVIASRRVRAEKGMASLDGDAGPPSASSSRTGTG